MSGMLERRAAPSLLARAPAVGARSGDAKAGGSALVDLMHEGFYVLFMLRNGAAPPDAATFMDRVSIFLSEFEREAKRLRADADDIHAAKYAFCAAADEIVLASPFPLREQWERRPLQLAVFGDQLAGEHFFDRLEDLRGKGAPRLAALQVFHMCLLLGFQGKYAHDGSEKLGYLTARLGDEIAHIKGRSRGFAPRAERPDQIVNRRRSEVPLWVLSAVFGLVGIGTYAGLDTTLTHATIGQLAPYANLVRLAPRPANLSIILP
jgi:type VI secretion system protein ImpK